jgi:HSP20 family protein
MEIEMHYLAKRPDGVNEDLLGFPRSVEDLFSRFWNIRPQQSRGEFWKPAVDIVETPQAYLLRAELPGVDPAEVDVTMTGETLTIRGAKRLDPVQDNQTWCLNERSSATFERSFSFPAPVSPKDIEAEAKFGVLTIKVMKAKEAQPHQVSIRTT